jgi:hypothetical protein
VSLRPIGRHAAGAAVRDGGPPPDELRHHEKWPLSIRLLSDGVPLYSSKIDESGGSSQKTGRQHAMRG